VVGPEFKPQYHQKEIVLKRLILNIKLKFPPCNVVFEYVKEGKVFKS
jgi:hypothetical protein